MQHNIKNSVRSYTVSNVISKTEVYQNKNELFNSGSTLDLLTRNWVLGLNNCMLTRNLLQEWSWLSKSCKLEQKRCMLIMPSGRYFSLRNARFDIVVIGNLPAEKLQWRGEKQDRYPTDRNTRKLKRTCPKTSDSFFEWASCKNVARIVLQTIRKGSWLAGNNTGNMDGVMKVTQCRRGDKHPENRKHRDDGTTLKCSVSIQKSNFVSTYSEII